MSELRYPFNETPAPGEVITIRDGVHWARMPLPIDLDHINVYLLEDGPDLWIVDTGIAGEQGRELWTRILQQCFPGHQLRHVLCTHMHMDHIGQAGWLCREYQVPLHMSRSEFLSTWAYRSGDSPSFREQSHHFYHRTGVGQEVMGVLTGTRPAQGRAGGADRAGGGDNRAGGGDKSRAGGGDKSRAGGGDKSRAGGGDKSRAGGGDNRAGGGDKNTRSKKDAKPKGARAGVEPMPNHFHCLQENRQLQTGEYEWRIMVGRGHSPEHVCLYCAEHGILLAGDQVLPRITSNISVLPLEPEANPLRDWFDSLEHFAQLPEDTLVLPAHNEPFYGLHERLRQIRDHHVEQLETLRRQCVEPQSAAGLMSSMFRRELSPMQTLLGIGECLAHLHFLMDRGEMQRELSDEGLYLYQATG